MPRVSLSDSFMKPFKACSDVTGLEVGADLSEGVPAVRLRKSKGQVEMVAAGFLDLPGALPMLSGARRGADVAVARSFQGAARGLGHTLAARQPTPYGRWPRRDGGPRRVFAECIPPDCSGDAAAGGQSA